MLIYQRYRGGGRLSFLLYRYLVLKTILFNDYIAFVYLLIACTSEPVEVRGHPLGVGSSTTWIPVGDGIQVIRP